MMDLEKYIKEDIRMHSNFIEGLGRFLKVVLSLITLVVSTQVVFFGSTINYWYDMAFIVWCLSVLTTIDIIDNRK